MSEPVEVRVVYLSVGDVARQLGMAERTVRNLAEQYPWFGGMLGSNPGSPWVFTQDSVNRMRTFPRPGPGRPRPRKPIEGVPTMESSPASESPVNCQ